MNREQTLLLDSEEWIPAEVPRELQEAVDAVLAQGQGHGQGQKSDKPKRAGLFKIESNKLAYFQINLIEIRELFGKMCKFLFKFHQNH